MASMRAHSCAHCAFCRYVARAYGGLALAVRTLRADIFAPSRPAYPRHTQPLIPLIVRPRKMSARPRGAQCGCARYRFVLPTWQPTFAHFLRLYPGSFIVHFGDIFVAIIPLRHILIMSLRHYVFIKKLIFYTFFRHFICIFKYLLVILHRLSERTDMTY